MPTANCVAHPTQLGACRVRGRPSLGGVDHHVAAEDRAQLWAVDVGHSEPRRPGRVDGDGRLSGDANVGDTEGRKDSRDEVFFLRFCLVIYMEMVLSTLCAPWNMERTDERDFV